MIIHTGVRIILRQTIFLPDFIMPQLHFCSPCFLSGIPCSVLSLHFCVFSLVPNSFTFAAADAANKYGNDDDTSKHRHGDDQNLKVDPTQPPSRVAQRTHTFGRQDAPHRVVDALLCWYAPQTCDILQALVTSGVGSRSTRNRIWRRIRRLSLCGENKVRI